jgi:23S rRNA pseudouridine1911/1915/1917 synthase
LDRVLAALEQGLSRSAAARLVREGLVTLNGRPARPADAVVEGDVIEYRLPAAEARPSAEAIPLRVLYDDGLVVVVDKPAGMVVHPAPGHRSGTLVHALLGLGGQWSSVGGSERPGIVHRLDRDTSGLILVARTDAAHLRLASQLRDRTLSRTYLAVVRGRIAVPDQVLEGPIGRHPRDRTRMAVVPGGRPARTRVRVLECRGGHTLVQCDLESGRTHQIRVHLAALGHPVVGDAVYGRRRPHEPERPMLHAWRLRFSHPADGREMSFEAPLPADFATFWEALR